MSLRKLWVFAGRVVLAGVLALIVLTLFCSVYYNVPYSVACEDGVTDYKWQAGSRYAIAREGIAWGRSNNDGYINTFDYEAGDRVDVLIMGPSHMQGFNVRMEESVTYRLNALLPDDVVYNVGIFNHYFLNNAANLEAAVQKYQPRKYIVMTMGSVALADEDIRRAMDGRMEKAPLRNDGVVGLLKRNPFFRLLSVQRTSRQVGWQVAGLDAVRMVARAAEDSSVQTADAETHEMLLRALLQKMQETAKESGARIIAVFLPEVRVQADGSLLVENDAEETAYFRERCDQNGILFLDMSDRFSREYEEHYALPFGFCNSAVGVGHLNRYGHAMLADELYQLILAEGA